MRKIVFILFVAFCFAFTSSRQENVYLLPEPLAANNVYLSPGPLAVSADGKTVYTALTGVCAIAVTNLSTGETTGKIETRQNPNNILLSPDGKTLWATTGEATGAVEIIPLPQNKTKHSIRVGHTPFGMALSTDLHTLYVANRFSNTISAINTVNNKIVAEIPVVREPRYMAISPDGKTLAAGNFLPAQASTDETVAAEISLIDTEINKVSARITLPNGSQSVMGVTFSPDGRYIYAVHLLSRFNLPITQIDRGWINTNALSIIDVNNKSCYATVLLDDIDRGAANPAGIGIAADGNLYIAITGCHELMQIDLDKMHDKIAKLFTGSFNDPYIKNEDDLSASLSFTYSLKRRIALQGRLPLNLAFTNDAVLVSSRFSPFIEKINLQSEQKPTQIKLGSEPALDSYRRGELAFNDALICFQQWQTCASCHPDGRADGLNWDQQNDGFGNPKNTKSLLFSHVTPPSMITGIRESAELAVRAGIVHTLYTVQPESLAADMDEYLKNMPVQESPYIRKASKKALNNGKKLFEKAGCASCHNGKYYTDLQKYDVGTGDGDDLHRPFDTPTLREAWRTAPYLYDGRAATLEEVLTKYNSKDQHGITSTLNRKEIEDLVLYINTL